eukprot:COSAG01_NODE_30185_length_621_cov_0.785441_1_plen_55_part_01
MAERRTESLSDLLPELGATLRDLSECKEEQRRVRRLARREHVRKERARRARQSTH